MQGTRIQEVEEKIMNVRSELMSVTQGRRAREVSQAFENLLWPVISQFLTILGAIPQAGVISRLAIGVS